jgi:predicted ester cyclase
MHAEWDEAFPDMEVEILALAAEGDHIVAHWQATGTHEASFRGIEPTGNTIEVTGFSYRKAEDGQFVEATDQAGMVSMLDQLGVEIPLQG